MKILIAHPGVDIYGGAEVLITHLSNYLAANGHTVGIVTNWLPNGMSKELDNNVKVHYAPSPSHSKAMNMVALWSGIQNYAYNYDIVNVHNFPASVAAFPVRKPVVWQCNEPPELFTSLSRKPIEAWNRYLVKNWIKKCVVSDVNNATRFKQLYKVEPDVVYYGVDYNFFSKQLVTHQLKGLNPAKNEYTVTQVGTITPYKNQAASIKAIAAVKEKIKNIRLIIIGEAADAKYSEYLTELIRTNDLGGYVLFEPHVTQKHLRSIYAVTDVLLHPVKKQGGWLTPFEAISAGVPVIVSKDLTCSHIIQGSQLGIVTDDYAKALLFSYIQRTEMYRTSEELQRRAWWVRDNLSWDNYGQRMLDIFSEVLSADKARNTR